MLCSADTATTLQHCCSPRAFSSACSLLLLALKHPPAAPTHAPSPTPSLFFPSPHVLCLATHHWVNVWGIHLMLALRHGPKAPKTFPCLGCDLSLPCTGTGRGVGLLAPAEVLPVSMGVNKWGIRIIFSTFCLIIHAE